MANLVIDPADVSPVVVWEQHSGPTGEIVDAGEIVTRDAADADFILSGAASAAAAGNKRGMSLTDADPAGEAITMVTKGIINVGDALDALDFDDPVFLSDTPGKLADVAGTVSIVAGHVVPGHGSLVPDKLLQLDL